ncbi:unnamed protein product [Alopecurus aequalis]
MGRSSKSDSSAILLYEAPTGFAIFSFDGRYLNNPVEDFWAYIPQLTLRMFMKYKTDSTFIDIANEAIDDCLSKRLTMWCGSKKKLVVGSAEYKRIIEMNLGITCVYVDAADAEAVSGRDKPIHTLLSEENSEATMKDDLPTGEVVMFLRQHRIDMKPEMVDKYVVEAVHLVHRIELREKEHLKFFRILLKDFMATLSIDTTKWSLIQFATVPKMICHPTASYQISHPDDIFSDDECVKIETNAPKYKQTFSKIDPLSVYEDVLSLHSEKSITRWDLSFLVKKAKRAQEKADVIRLCVDQSSGEPNRTDLPANGSYQLEAPNSAEPKQQVILNQTCIAEGHHCLVPDEAQEKLAVNMDDVEENKQAGDTGLHSMDDDSKLTRGLVAEKQNEEFHATSAGLNSRRGKQNEVVPTTRARLKSVPSKVLHVEKTENEEKEASTKSWVMSFRWQISKRDASAVRSRSHEETDGRSKAIKQTCMRFTCCYSVQCLFGFACQDGSQEY